MRIKIKLGLLNLLGSFARYHVFLDEQKYESLRMQGPMFEQLFLYDIRDGGSGYAIWYGDLIDIRQVAAIYIFECLLQRKVLAYCLRCSLIRILKCLLFFFFFFVRYNRISTTRDFTN